MAQKTKKHPKAVVNKPKSVTAEKKEKISEVSFFPWMLISVFITAICFSPILKNNFTNWDDGAYVINNFLLRGPDWKGIFTQPIASNYHPLTILSLALNFQFSGLEPYSYFLVNLVLHLINTALVFYFIWNISGKQKWVAVLTAVIFGIHPMHVESVAWISERKDVLYTLFYLISLIAYWRYLKEERKKSYWLSFLFFIFSLLSKPAAIVLPLVLLLLDYWNDRPFTKKLIVEKIPFFAASLLFTVITLQTQSDKAIAGLDLYPLWSRLFFAPYTVMVYLFRFFIPIPLSAYHPFPSTDHLGFWVYVAPAIIAALAIIVWLRRKDKLVVFSLLFFLFNLLLVLQLISIGSSIVSERYTYVPYIGLGFLISTWLYKLSKKFKPIKIEFIGILIAFVFGLLSYQRSKVWKDSVTLWTDVIDHYPEAPVPRTNRANAILKLIGKPEYANETDQLFQKALEDCAVARNGDPAFYRDVYETRGLTYLHMNRYKDALADGDSLISIAPELSIGYSIRGTAYMYTNEPEKALKDFDACLTIDPFDHSSFNNRGTTLYNYFQKYPEAISNFNRAIEIEPKPLYFLNRSRSYHMTGNIAKAREDLLVAMENGMAVPEDFKKMVLQ